MRRKSDWLDILTKFVMRFEIPYDVKVKVI